MYHITLKLSRINSTSTCTTLCQRSICYVSLSQTSVLSKRL